MHLQDLQVYQRALDFAVEVIKIIDEIEAPRKHYRLIEQIEASSTSVASNISGRKAQGKKITTERHGTTRIKIIPTKTGIQGFCNSV